MNTFADAVKEYSGGSVTCSVYSDSTLFSSENEWDAINQGQDGGGADMAYISFPTLSTQAGLEWCAMINTAYFWSSYDHMTSVLNGEIGQQMYARIAEKTGITPLNGFYLGSRVINTRTKQIDKQADMTGILLRMPSSEAWLNLGRALGAEPTSMAFSELYTALQTGAIEGQDNPLPSDINGAFYEVAPYFAITNHVVDSILPCINTNTWNKLTDAQKRHRDRPRLQRHQAHRAGERVCGLPEGEELHRHLPRHQRVQGLCVQVVRRSSRRDRGLGYGPVSDHSGRCEVTAPCVFHP